MIEHEPGHVVKVPGAYFVKSRTTPGAWWMVVGLECTCPAEKPICWHVRRTFAWHKDQTPKRPTAKPNIGALCD